MSALLGRIPSAVGYQPTLATDLGQLQERITTTKKGSITSVQVRAAGSRLGGLFNCALIGGRVPCRAVPCRAVPAPCQVAPCHAMLAA